MITLAPDLANPGRSSTQIVFLTRIVARVLKRPGKRRCAARLPALDQGKLSFLSTE
jgi:hypothetical protein